MKQTITQSMFLEAFKRAGRGEQFSREALEALFAHFEEYERDGGEEIELDVIGICCDFSESTFDEVMRDYKLDDDDDKGARYIALAYLNEQTVIIAVLDDSMVYARF
jgi:hypothetical protein